MKQQEERCLLVYFLSIFWFAYFLSSKHPEVSANIMFICLFFPLYKASYFFVFSSCGL